MFFDPLYLLMMAPAMLLMMWAQFRIKSAYASGMEVPARLTGAAAAQHILDVAGADDVTIEVTDGMMTDHYDPRGRVLRLSREVYSGRTATAVGIAAHEAGHALQDVKGYALMGVRNLAVPMANFGSGVGMMMIMFGFMLQMSGLVWLGIIAFSGMVFFQMVNLFVEFDASNRAKRVLTQLGIVDASGSGAVTSVLNAAAWTYVAATLQAVMQLAYFIMRASGQSRRDD